MVGIVRSLMIVVVGVFFIFIGDFYISEFHLKQRKEFLSAKVDCIDMIVKGKQGGLVSPDMLSSLSLECQLIFGERSKNLKSIDDKSNLLKYLNVYFFAFLSMFFVGFFGKSRVK